MQFLFI